MGNCVHRFDYSKVDSSVIEGVDEETFSFRWNIHKCILANLVRKQTSMKSPEFTGGETGQHSWYILFETGGCYANLRLGLSKFGENNAGNRLLVSVQISILNENDKAIYESHSKDDVEEYTTENTTSSCLTFWSKRRLRDNGRGLIRNDHLNVHCHVWVRTDKKLFDPIRHELVMNTNSLQPQSVRPDLRKLLESTDYSDVVIATPTKEFKAHKNILSARSSVFAAMFQSDMIEASSGKIAISDFSDNIIQEMLNFVYSGGVENMKDKEMELLRIADKYDIHDLKSECTQRVLSILTCENVTEILLLVDRLNIVPLKNDIIDFITNNARAVKATVEFKNLNSVDPELFCEVIFAMLEKLS